MSKSKKQSHDYQACPICGRQTGIVFNIKETTGDNGFWFQCNCGVIFQKTLPKQDIYTKEYVDNLNSLMKAKLRYNAATRIYLPLIEEIVTGRHFLDIGYGVLYNIEDARNRGWIAWGIEKNTFAEKRAYTYFGDFETYDFHKVLRTPEIIKRTGKSDMMRQFDCLWLGHTLQCFKDPIKALQKCFTLLSNGGIIYISTPDINFIQVTGLAGWPHWRMREFYILWSARALKRELERIGFQIVLCRSNYAMRFGTAYDIHLLAQKPEG